MKFVKKKNNVQSIEDREEEENGNSPFNVNDHFFFLITTMLFAHKAIIKTKQNAHTHITLM